MARLSKLKVASGKRILLVDDEEDYRSATETLLIREGHEVITASNGEEAISILQQQHLDLVLLDYFMSGGFTGETVVQEIRKFNQIVQVILQTGYSGEYPPREMMRRLDIQGYHDKTDGPEKLLLWVEVGLKAADAIQMLNRSRQGLQYILDVTPELHKIQSLEHLLQGILLQITGLVGTVSSFLAVIPEGKGLPPEQINSDAFIAMLEEEANLQIHVATGRFSNNHSLESCLDPVRVKVIHDMIKSMEVKFGEEYTILPLTFADSALGVIFLEQNIVNPQDMEILKIFANQAALAIQNTRLFELATTDKLTGVYVRNFFNQWLLRELHTSFRHHRPLSLVLVDLDRLKQINDTEGHVAGDTALAIVGKVLRKASRTTDFVGRYGGDEFVIILPNTPLENVHFIAERILESLKDQKIEGDFGVNPIQCSIGACGLVAGGLGNEIHPGGVPKTYFETMAKLLIEGADQSTY